MKSSSTSFALSVAALLVAGCDKEKPGPQPMPSAAVGTAEVQCLGVNECKGKSACHTAEHACAGENACKGKGWISLPEPECKARGGKVM